MANKVLLKKSAVLGKIPSTSDLDYGELAINYSDGKLYYKNSANQIRELAGGGGGGGTLIAGTRGGPVNIVISGGSFLVGTRSGDVSVQI